MKRKFEIVETNTACLCHICNTETTDMRLTGYMGDAWALNFAMCEECQKGILDELRREWGK